jgi:hypothetical protein
VFSVGFQVHRRASLAMNVEVRAVAASRANSYSVSPIRADARLQESVLYPRRSGTFITLALRMIPAPIREKAGACSYTVAPATRSGVTLRGLAL